MSGIPRIIKRHAWYVVGAAATALAAIGTLLIVRQHTAGQPQSLHLADGTDVFFLPDTRIEPAAGYPRPREVRVNGDAFFRALAGETPLIVRTRLLTLTVTGATAFRVTAYSQQTGEQVEVLHGQVRASKSYASSYSEPDYLTGGEMCMINRTIDLMEKETFDPEPLRKWSHALIASAERRQRPASP